MSTDKDVPGSLSSVDTYASAIGYPSVGDNAPLLQPDLGDNLAGTFEVLVGDPDAAFATADRIVTGQFYVQRYTGMPLETRTSTFIDSPPL